LETDGNGQTSRSDRREDRPTELYEQAERGIVERHRQGDQVRVREDRYIARNEKCLKVESESEGGCPYAEVAQEEAEGDGNGQEHRPEDEGLNRCLIRAGAQRVGKEAYPGGAMK